MDSPIPNGCRIFSSPAVPRPEPTGRIFTDDEKFPFQVLNELPFAPTMRTAFNTAPQIPDEEKERVTCKEQCAPD